MLEKVHREEDTPIGRFIPHNPRDAAELAFPGECPPQTAAATKARGAT